MTPEEARARLKNKGRDLTRKERKALNTIANMTPEYCVEVQVEPGDPWQKVTQWHENPNPLRPGYELAPNERIVKRYATYRQPLGEEQ